MLASVKNWCIDKCWYAFGIDKFKKKSQTVVIVLGITFLLALAAVIAVIFAYIDIHVWSRKGHVILVPQERLVTINGNLYIPIKIV